MNNDLRLIATTAGAACGDLHCPTVFESVDGDVVIQGFVEPISTPDGEGAVRIPKHLWAEANGKMAQA